MSQGTRQETESNAVYTPTAVDWSRRIVLLMPNGAERDGGALDFGGATPGQNITDATISDTLIGMGYSPWFTLPGLAIFSGDGAPQTHAFCACLAVGGTIRVVAFERLVDLTSFVSQWTSILDVVNTEYTS
jgi:hypothetical protein